MRLIALQRIYSVFCALLAAFFVGLSLYIFPRGALGSERFALLVPAALLATLGGGFLLTAVFVLRRPASGAGLSGFTGALLLLYGVGLLVTAGGSPLGYPVGLLLASAGGIGVYLGLNLNRVSRL
jgi:hypothetical protein